MFHPSAKSIQPTNAPQTRTERRKQQRRNMAQAKKEGYRERIAQNPSLVRFNF